MPWNPMLSPSTRTCPSLRRPPWIWNTLKIGPDAPPMSFPWMLSAGTNVVRPKCTDGSMESRRSRRR